MTPTSETSSATDWDAVAQVLGPGWTAIPLPHPGTHGDTTFALLDGTSDLRVRISIPFEGDRTQRYRISGLYDRLHAQGLTETSDEHFGDIPAIHLSRTRSPQAIAQEITRRLLPAYHEAACATIARTHERRWRQSLVTHAADAILTLVRAAGAREIRPSSQQASDTAAYYVTAPVQSANSLWGPVECRFEVKPGYGREIRRPTYVTIERISELSPHQASHLLCALMTLPPREDDPMMPPVPPNPAQREEETNVP